MTNTDIAYCMQEHQIDLCKTCFRNFKKYEKTIKVTDKVSMTTFTPNLTPTQNCYGYLNYKKINWN